MYEEKQKKQREEPPRNVARTSVYPTLLDKGDIAKTFAVAILFLILVLGSLYGLYHLIL